MTRPANRNAHRSRGAGSPPPEVLALRRRVTVVGVLLVALALLPMWKLVQVQARDVSDLAGEGRAQRLSRVTLQPTRGSILDRNGVELAISLPRRSVGVDMAALRLEGVDTPADLDRFARELAAEFDVDPDRLSARFIDADPDAPWVQVADPVEEDVAREAIARVEAQGIHDAVVTGRSSARVHPAGRSALRVIGTLGADGPAKHAGIERAYDEELSGRAGRMTVETGITGATVPGTERVIEEPVSGSDVVTTLDRTLQHEVEQILIDGVEGADAASGVAIVGRPGSGELLAVGSAERDSDTGEVGLSLGPSAFADSFQAGSVFKVVTIAAALEAGLVNTTQTLDVPDHIQIADRSFEDYEPHETLPMTVGEIVAHSSNVGTIKIAQALGKDRLRQALVDFGFGSRTGVGHPAESAGIVPPAGEWTDPDLAASAIGTHQSGTALQLWAAYNVIANRGLYVKPRLVSAVISPDGTRRELPVEEPRRVVSEQTAAAVGPMLEQVVSDGTGSNWEIPGYSIAAKTGTSRMIGDNANAEDGYAWNDGRQHHMAAFTGYFPADRPEVSITVILVDVGPGLTGSSAAGPVFSDLARLSIRELGIAPSRVADGLGPDAANGAGAALGGGGFVRARPAARVDGGADE